LQTALDVAGAARVASLRNRFQSLARRRTFALLDRELSQTVNGDGARMPKAAMLTKRRFRLMNSSTISALNHPVSHIERILMRKTRKTAKELADLIAARIGVAELSIGVRKDHAFGWQPMIEYAPGNQLGFQRRADEIAEKLREQYELQD
jgi:hypothetical protein